MKKGWRNRRPKFRLGKHPFKIPLLEPHIISAHDMIVWAHTGQWNLWRSVDSDVELIFSFPLM